MPPSLDAVIAASPAQLLPGRYVIARAAGQAVPPSAFAVIRDDHETTVIVEERGAADLDAEATERWFRAIALHVAAPFDAPGFIAAAASDLAAAGINVYVISTFSRDYLFVREEDAEQSMAELAARGFAVPQVGREAATEATTHRSRSIA